MSAYLHFILRPEISGTRRLQTLLFPLLPVLLHFPLASLGKYGQGVYLGSLPTFVSFVRRVSLRMTAVGWAFCCRCFCISEGVSPYHYGYGALLLVIVLIHDACLGG